MEKWKGHIPIGVGLRLDKLKEFSKSKLNQSFVEEAKWKSELFMLYNGPSFIFEHSEWSLGILLVDIRFFCREMSRSRMAISELLVSWGEIGHFYLVRNGGAAKGYKIRRKYHEFGPSFAFEKETSLLPEIKTVHQKLLYFSQVLAHTIRYRLVAPMFAGARKYHDFFLSFCPHMQINLFSDRTHMQILCNAKLQSISK